MSLPDACARLIAAALCLAALPASAGLTRPATPPASAGAMSPDEYRSLLGDALVLAENEDCPNLLALVDPDLPRITGKDRNAVQMLRIPCLGATGRGKEVPGIYREMIAVDPQNGTIQGIGVMVASYDGDFLTAGERLASLAEDRPEALNSVTSVVVAGIVQELTRLNALAVRDRMLVALVRADWQPPDRPDMRDSLAQGAIDALLTRKEVDEAGTLLDRVTMPELLTTMATERHYQPLWPQIEARLGEHGARAIDRFAASRLDAFTRNPDDERTRLDAIRAFVLLGRLNDADEIASQVTVSAGLSEEAVTSIRYHAQVMVAQGRRERAIALLRPFAALDVRTAPAAVSGLVVLAEMLDENGQPAEALAVARDTAAKAGDAISPWGRGWLRRSEACALATLGRRQEAARAGDALIAAASDNEAAAIEGLLCLGRVQEASVIAVRTLGTAEGASSLADQFQPEGAFAASAPSRLRALWVPFLARPEVKAAFDRSARLLPRTLWPAREPRPIPRVRPAADSGPVA